MVYIQSLVEIPIPRGLGFPHRQHDVVRVGNLNLTSSWDNNTSSSFQRSRCPPSPATNQPLENLALPNPSTKKPCGRPAGSKNKPKTTPFSRAQPMEPCMKVIIVNVTPSSDIIESILDVAH
ncbi:hypothetical protein GmHk_20G056974 [Glycine max]|nr:hypothetical protein GmHk_20G056974 [Glycine max]